MRKEISISRGLKKGDLVTHVLYGREWIGIILEIIDIYERDANNKDNHRELALIGMQPGTRYEYFFRDMVSKRNRVTDSLGMVSVNWLFKLQERKV